jgi:undecaprenyl-diphosphatase
MIDFFQTIILGFIEGLTEFLPISSTAHLIVGELLLDVPPSPFLNFFTIFIQLGAISAVPILYFNRLTSSLLIYKFIIISFIPAVVLGVLLDDFLESLFQGYWFICISWIIGGYVLIKIDKWIVDKEENPSSIENMSINQAFNIGLYQCLAMIPGVSRSGASIIGGRIVGLKHRDAIEFSFLLGIPTILGACAKKVLDYRDNIVEFTVGTNGIYLLVAFIISFIVALFSIKFMVNLVKNYGFKYFGYYRIVIGLIFGFYLLWK